MDDAGSSPFGVSRIRARGPMDRALSFYLRGLRFESARACQCPGVPPLAAKSRFSTSKLCVFNARRLQPARLLTEGL